MTPLYTRVARAVDETGGFLSETCGDHNMHSGDVALRFSIVFAVAGFITMAAGVYEIDRREKSSAETVTANLTETEQRVPNPQRSNSCS